MYVIRNKYVTNMKGHDLINFSFYFFRILLFHVKEQLYGIFMFLLSN